MLKLPPKGGGFNPPKVGAIKEDALLIVEAKKSEKGISSDNISQARSYAQETLAPYYVISNGKQIIVYQFNCMLSPDERIMDFNTSQLYEKWSDLYSFISKQSALKRKIWMKDVVKKTI